MLSFAEDYVLFPPVGFKGSLSLLDIYVNFPRGLQQMEVQASSI